MSEATPRSDLSVSSTEELREWARRSLDRAGSRSDQRKSFAQLLAKYWHGSARRRADQPAKLQWKCQRAWKKLVDLHETARHSGCVTVTLVMAVRRVEG